MAAAQLCWKGLDSSVCEQHHPVLPSLQEQYPSSFFLPPPTCVPAPTPVILATPQVHVSHLHQLLPSGLQMCAASAVLTPQTANWGLFLTSRLVSLVWRTNPPDSSVLTCPSLSPTSRQLPALLFCLFQSSAAKMVLHSPDPSGHHVPAVFPLKSPMHPFTAIHISMSLGPTFIRPHWRILETTTGCPPSPGSLPGVSSTTHCHILTT